MAKASRLFKLTQLTLTGALLLLLGAVIFRDFIFGDKVLLYKDIGDDSTNSYYPYLVLFSRYLRTDGLPMWSFHVGMGQNIFSGLGDLLFQPSIWFPPGAIAYLLVYQHLFHVLAAGLLFYGCLTMRGLNFCASLLGSLFFTFSSFMCMGSCWLIFGNEVICIAFVLFGVEVALRRGRWLPLALAVGLFALLSAFHIYLCAILLLGYAAARLYIAPTPQTGSRPARIISFAMIAALGLGLTAPVWLDSAQAIYHSPRGTGPESYAHQLLSSGVFHLESPLNYFTSVWRTFSNDILGTGDNFRGWSNYLEASSSYAGLFPLLMLPQAFVRAQKRRRLIYALLFVSIIVTLALPWFRYLFWLFQGNYYRTLSFFSITAVILLSMKALSRYFEKGILNLWLLGGTLIVLLVILFLPLPQMQKLIDPFLRAIVALFLVSYALGLALGRWLRKEPLFSWLIVFVSMGELAYFSSTTVASTPTVTKTELQQRIGYNDSTKEALQQIRTNDPAFYRITKTYSSSVAEHESLNDAIIFDFYGTSSYNSFNNIDYIRFLTVLEAISPQRNELETRWSLGSLGRPFLSTFLAEKYLLAKEPLAAPQGLTYDEIARFNDVYAYRNATFLPFGLFVDTTISESIFRQLSALGKELILIQAVILDDSAPELAQTPSPDLDAVINMVEASPFLKTIQTRSDSALRLAEFRQNHLEGKISCLTNGFLVFQMPFDSGWDIQVDGAHVSPRRVDVGLIGIPLGIGVHKVALSYLPPLLRPGLIVSGLSLVILLLASWRWPRLKTLTN